MLLAVLTATLTAQRPMLMPTALKAGDTVAIVSPSSAPEADVVERGCETLRQWGYVPVLKIIWYAKAQRHKELRTE